MSDKTLLLLTALASLLCVVWACFVPAYGMAAAMVANAIYSFVMAFKIERMI